MKSTKIGSSLGVGAWRIGGEGEALGRITIGGVHRLKFKHITVGKGPKWIGSGENSARHLQIHSISSRSGLTISNKQTTREIEGKNGRAQRYTGVEKKEVRRENRQLPREGRERERERERRN